MSISVQIQLPTDAELEQLLNMVPKLEQYKIIDKAVDAASKPVVKRARQLAPRGKQADRDKRSRNQRGKADWNYPLWKTIKRVVRKYGRSYGVAVVGPEWPKGNKAYFFTSPRGRRVFYWGRDAGKTKATVRNWIVQAFDETKADQLAAMKASLIKSIDEAMRG